MAIFNAIHFKKFIHFSLKILWFRSKSRKNMKVHAKSIKIELYGATNASQCSFSSIEQCKHETDVFVDPLRFNQQKHKVLRKSALWQHIVIWHSMAFGAIWLFCTWKVWVFLQAFYSRSLREFFQRLWKFLRIRCETRWQDF